jgi:predicted outer membrane protein
MGFTSETAKLAGKKSSNANKKHFATVLLTGFAKNTKGIKELFQLALERQVAMLKMINDERRGFSLNETKEFDALSKITNKGIDKLIPTQTFNMLADSDGNNIEIIVKDFTDNSLSN